MPSPDRDHDSAATVELGAVDPQRLAHAVDRPDLSRYRIEDVVGSGGMGFVYAAHDLELDRSVALKVMRRDAGPESEQGRLRDEARAIAALNHPNIVPVYDVGHSDDGRLYMSMELVRGKNLQGWLDAGPRTWNEVLDVLLASGRGLAAAHAVGLVHCDFKPGNVLVGDDGRVRVVDFGIAQRSFLTEPSMSVDAPAEPTKKHVIGTPDYMSPEQARGAPLAPQSDQFSFCLTLYEALYGHRPFLGSSNRKRLRNILQGAIRPPPRGTLVPKRVHAVVVRGLHADPGLRWPGMHDLLRSLDRARRPRGWSLVGAVALLGIGAAAVSAAKLVEADSPCASTRDELDEVWTEQRKDRIREAFMQSGLPDAARLHESTAQQLDRYSTDWVASRTRACEDASAPAERRLAARSCLRRGLEQFEVLVEILGTADLPTVRNAPEAISSLPDLAGCEGADEDDANAPSEDIRARVEALSHDLSIVPMLIQLHRDERADELTARVLHEAEQLGHAPLLAEAQYRRADVLATTGEQVQAAATFERAFHTAETTRLDRLAAEIAIDLLLTYGYRLPRPKQTDQWSKLARAAVERLGDDARSLRPELTRTEGLIALRRSEYALARSLFVRALNEFGALDPVDEPTLAETSSNLGIACLELGLLDEAEAAFLEALTLAERTVGPYNNRMISVVNNLGSLAQARGDYQAAHDYFERVYRAELILYGPVDVRVAMSLNNMGTALSSLRRDREATEFYRRSIRAYESGDHHDIDLARPLGNLAVSNMRAEDYVAAEANLQRAIQLIEAEAGPLQAELGIHWFNLGAVRIEQGEYDRALEALERSREIDENAVGRDHPSVAQALSSIATIHARTGELERARPLFEEALEIYARFEVQPVTIAFTRFELARVLWEMNEHERARELVDRAETALVGAKEAGAPQLETLRKWKRTEGLDQDPGSPL